MRVQQIFLWYCNDKHKYYTYQTLEPSIESIAIAGAPNFSPCFIQEGASKRYKVKLHIRYEIFIIIMNEEEVEEEQLFIWK